jgi:hypothetical protein
MDIRRELTAPCDVGRLFAWVEDLAIYPQWMGLVHQVADADEHGIGTPASNVELRAQVGPFARSKALRMERTEHLAPCEGSDGESSAAPGRATFERRELDGREHSLWRLRATVSPGPTAETSGLTMELQYGGSLWGGAVLQRVLDDAVRRASERLVELVSDAPKR